jgi:glycogen operon protein
VQEFKSMVKALHAAGIEVILDVVYNHTAEGNHLGPTLAFRGLDNSAYYRLAEDRRYYEDTTGTGNSLLMRHPHVLQLIMDSLRYWVTEMHVDGFRFDLAATLARQFHEVDRLSSFFDLVQQDPVVSQAKLIAEPWDVGEGGYQVGNFPPLWTEWNGQYRDTVRDLWRGENAALAEFGSRLTGSSDLYQDDGRRPIASINFVTCHDGFTLRDLVSYNEKHNGANHEDNRDGESFNRSWNCGAEGDTDDPGVLALRGRQQRNFIATLMLSQGVPMLSHGDEFGRTQSGNNNAYCQDSDISWVHWPEAAMGPSRMPASPEEEEPKNEEDNAAQLLEFTRHMVWLRRDHPVFRRRRFFHGRPVSGTHDDLTDIAWFTPGGEEMTGEDWSASYAKSLTVFLNGYAISEPDRRGGKITDDSFLLLFNAGDKGIDFTVPINHGREWQVVVDTALPWVIAPGTGQKVRAGDGLHLADRSMMVLQRPA